MSEKEASSSTNEIEGAVVPKTDGQGGSNDALVDVDYTEAEERKVMRKVDAILIPILTLLYLLSFLDSKWCETARISLFFVGYDYLSKSMILNLCFLFLFSFSFSRFAGSNIGNAKLEGLVTDLKIKDYNTLLSVFFIGYVIVEIPANLVLKVTTPRFWLPTLTLLWGITSVTMGLCHDQSGIYAARFFLGVVEAGLFPGVVYTFSTYYKRKERTVRVSFFFSAAAAAGAFGGVLAYGLSQIDGGGKPRWAWIFIVEGLFTIVVAGLAYFIVPSWPAKAHQFTHRERAIIQHRLQFDSDAFETQGFQWSEVIRAFKSPQIYGYCFLFHGFAFALYTLSLFLPTIIQSLGYKSWQAQLLSTPVSFSKRKRFSKPGIAMVYSSPSILFFLILLQPYAFAFIITMLTAFVSNKVKLRAPFIIGSGFIAIIGYIVLLTSPTPGGRYVAVFICAAGVYAGNALLLAWPSENLMGHTYRATGLAMVITIGDIGAIIGTQLYRIPLGGLANKSYEISYIITIAYLVIGILSAAALYFGLSRQNTRWDEEENKRGAAGQDKNLGEGDNVKAWQRSFRYQV